MRPAQAPAGASRAPDDTFYDEGESSGVQGEKTADDVC